MAFGVVCPLVWLFAVGVVIGVMVVSVCWCLVLLSIFAIVFYCCDCVFIVVYCCYCLFIAVYCCYCLFIVAIVVYCCYCINVVSVVTVVIVVSVLVAMFSDTLPLPPASSRHIVSNVSVVGCCSCFAVC